MYKIIVFDLDGTLTNSNKEISPLTKNVIMQLQKVGIKVVLASGRPTCGIVHLANELKLDKHSGYILSYNGGQIINYSTKEVIYSTSVPPKFVPNLYRYSKEYSLTILSYKNECVICENSDDKYVQMEAKINDMPIIKVDNFVETIDIDVPKFLIVGNPEYTQKLETVLSKEYEGVLNIYRSEPYFLEVLPMNIDKAYSLSRLLEHLNLERTNLIAFGDGFNDLSMIKYAGLGVAMANAQEVVKQAADCITLSNDDDGIAHTLNKIFQPI